MKLPEEIIREKYYKEEITFEEAKRQLENLIGGLQDSIKRGK